MVSNVRRVVVPNAARLRLIGAGKICKVVTMNRWQHSGPPSKLQRFYEKHSSHVLTSRGLRQQCRLFRGTSGASEDNREAGFVPAFLNRDTGEPTFQCTQTDAAHRSTCWMVCRMPSLCGETAAAK